MLLRQPERILVDNLSASTVTAVSGGVNVAGYGTILSAEILDAYCQCPSDCVAQVTVVCITIPESCECPYEWPLTIKSRPCTTSYEVQNTLPQSKYYGYQNPSGATPTANETATAIAANINADPNAIVSATVGTFIANVFTPASNGTCIRLTELDCDLTCGFDAYSEAGTITTTTEHENGILTSTVMAKLFPIQWGHVGARPSIAYCGTYCVFHFRLRKACDVQDISQANAFNCYEQEVYFYVQSSNAADFATYWNDEMQAAFPSYLNACS